MIGTFILVVVVLLLIGLLIDIIEGEGEVPD